MSTPVAGALAVTPLYTTSGDALVSWDDAGATWRSLGTIPVGTVTSIAAGTGITVSPSPITGAGTVGLTVPVAVANGGTGTSTVMTAGSVTFAGPSGVRAQDNANFFWDDGNNRLGIGTTAPATSFHVWNGRTRLQTVAGDPLALALGRLDFPTGMWFLGTSASATPDLLFQNVAASERMRITDGGNVGIGTAGPATSLHVARVASYNDNYGAVVISDGTTLTKKLYIAYDASVGANGAGSIQTVAAGVAFTNLLLNPGGGNVGIGTATAGSLLTANGVCANVSGAWTTISAREMKDAESVQPYSRGLEALVQLRPVTFRYTSESPFARPADDPGDPLIGLIADEVAPHVPEIVGETTATAGPDAREIAISTLEPGLLIFAVINALKEVAARLSVLEAKFGAG